MPTEKQREASRANGARSRGPLSAAGKARSALNALRHGLFAESALLPGESVEEYRRLRLDYLATFHPRTVGELAAVNELIAAAWRLRRVRKIEHAAYLLAFEEGAPEWEERYPQASPEQRLALAHQHLVETGTLAPIERQEGRLARLHAQAAVRLDRVRVENADNRAAVAAALGASGAEGFGEDAEADWGNEPEEGLSSVFSDDSEPEEEAAEEPEQAPERPRTRAAGAGWPGDWPQGEASEEQKREFLARRGLNYAPEPEDEPEEGSGG